MELRDVTYQGPPIDEPVLLERLPKEYRQLLEQINGFIQFGGGLHVRGICREPPWHSLQLVWTGTLAIHRWYSALTPTDVPFGQDALGDQFVLRDEEVYRLSGETGDLESLDRGLCAFLKEAQAHPVEYLSLQPLVQFYHEGGSLEPGQLLSVYPPFCTKEAEAGVSLRAVPTLERIAFLADFASRIAGLGDGRTIRINVVE